jgi:multiple sugar transport system substrate-binding protein
MKRLLSIIIIVALAVGLVSACSDSNSSTKGTDANTTTTTQNTQADDTSTEPGSEDGSEYGDLPSDYEGTLTMWGWDDPYFKAITEGFNQLYPNVKFEYTPVANGDLLQKYQTALATGTELPDIAWSIVDSRAKVFELDMWEPLNKEPYNFNIDDVFDYLHPIMVNSAGEVCGIEQCISPAGIAYRRDLTLEYFGTDDPEELADMFPTWDAFIEKGKEVYEKSNGEIHMWPGIGDAQQFILGQDPMPWIEGDTVNATKAFKRSIDLTVKLRDNNAVDKLEAWSPAWYASYGEGKHIFAGCATWSVPFVIAENDPEGEAAGHWGLMNAPEGNISWGGTTLGISKTCEDKELAWCFIKYATLSTEGAQALNKIGFMTSAKAPYEEKPELKSFKSPWFGDQDLGKMFLEEIIPNVEIRPMNIDDNVVHNAVVLLTTSLNNDPSLTSDKALEQLKEELELQLPDYNIE